MVNNQMNDLLNMLRSMESNVQTITDLTRVECEDAGFKFDIMEDLYRFTEDQIKEFTPSVIINIYSKFELPSKRSEFPTSYDEKVEFIRKRILELHKSAISYRELINDRDTLVKDVEKALEDYSAYLSSDKIKAEEAKKLNELKDRIESCEDESEKRKLSARLKILEDSESLEFFFDRIDECGGDELKRIMNSFLDKHKSSYDMNKYTIKMKQMGYKPETFKSMLDIEANFLDESFYPFNNLFLYASIRFIAYTNIHSEKELLYTQTLIRYLSKLVFHKLNKGEENFMIEMIKRFDSKFEGSRDLFIEKNLTSPLSSYRIEMEKKRKEETLINIENWFSDSGISLPSWYSYEDKIKYMRIMQEKLALKSWLDMYEIPYPEDSSVNELRKIKDSFNAVPPKKEKSEEESTEENEVSKEETAEESEIPEAEDDSDTEKDSIEESSEYSEE